MKIENSSVDEQKRPPDEGETDTFDASSDAPGPEHVTKNKLTEWLERHGATVWWEEANAWDHEQFVINRDGQTPQGRPDLVVGIGGYWFVLEFKSGKSKGGVYDALLQVHGYWLSHVVHNQDYLIDGEPVTIDGFLTATLNSRFGRLFPAYGEGELQTLEDMDEGRAACTKYNQLPRAEYPMTEQHVRTLWRLEKRSLSNLNVDINDTQIPNLGALLSDHLEVEQFDPTPAVLWNDGPANQAWEVLST